MEADRRLRVLTFASLFPSDAQPRHGIFVETRLAQLVRHCPVEARVVAPVPWFPFKAAAFGAYARYAATPRHAVRPGGLQVSHPRYVMLPRLGVAFQPDSMAWAAAGEFARLSRSGWRPEIVDAHYLYPDGVAAAILAARWRLPFVLTARGSDVNVLARLAGPRRRILWAARRAAAVVAVSTRLKEGLVELGIEPDHVVVLRNGVDPELFRPEDRDAARRRLGLSAGRLAACVGNLVEAKGFGLAIEALPLLPDLRLLFVGDGPLRAELGALAARLGVADRVEFRGVVPQRELRCVYCAVDVVLLTSRREGWPNVVLEALACATPVVALDVGAVAEMITDPAVGRIVAARDPTALAAAVRDVLAAPADRVRIRSHACRFGWEPISSGQHAIMRRAVVDLSASGPHERC